MRLALLVSRPASRREMLLAALVIFYPNGTLAPPINLQLNSVALLGDFLVSLLVASMLRFRARSVYNAAPGAGPAGALECYGRALKRVPWLLATTRLI